MKPPAFSVIIPVFNAAASIEASVASVLAQSDGDFDILMLDDGSTDGSLAVMLDLAGSDDRIHVVSHANRGVAATRNLGVELTRGGLITFLDADDRWHPEKLAHHRALHEADPAIGVSFGRIAFVEAGSAARVRSWSTVPAGRLSLAQLIGENPVCTASNIVVTRRCFATVRGFRTGMGYAEDQEWLARVADSAFPIQGIDELLVDYVMSPDGLSANLERMYAGWCQLAFRYGGRFDLDAAEATYCRYLARRALRSGRSSFEALRFALRGLYRDPAAFFNDRHRGGLTLAGAIVSPFLPAALRARVFS